MMARLVKGLFRRSPRTANMRLISRGHTGFGFSSANKRFFCSAARNDTALRTKKAFRALFISSCCLGAAYFAALAFKEKKSAKSSNWASEKLCALLMVDKNSPKNDKYPRVKFIAGFCAAKTNISWLSNLLMDLGFLDQAFDVLTNKHTKIAPKTIKTGAASVRLAEPLETPPTLVLVDGIGAEQRPVLRFDFFEFEEDERPILSVEYAAKADPTPPKKQTEKDDSPPKKTTAFEPALGEENLARANFAVVSVVLPPGSANPNQTLTFSFYNSVGDMKKEGLFHARVLAFQYVFALADRRSILLARPDAAEAFVRRASRDLVLHSTPEISALGSALMAELAQEPRLCAMAARGGGLDALLRASLARNPSVAMSAVFPLAALVRNCPDEALKVEPKQRELLVRALLQAAGALLNQGNAAHALLALKDCVRLEPENFGALTLLAAAHIKLGDADDATDCLRKLVEKIPFAPDIRYNLAAHLYSAHRRSAPAAKEEAAAQLKRGFELGPSSRPESFALLLAEVLGDLGRHAEAAYYLNRFCQAKEGRASAEARVELASALLRTADPPAAVLENARQAIKSAESLKTSAFSADALRKIAAVHLRTGDVSAARDKASAALQTAPGDARALALLGRAEARCGNWAAAEEAFLRLRSAREKLSPTELFALAEAQWRLQKGAQGEATCLEALRSLGGGAARIRASGAEKAAVGALLRRCREGHCSADLEKAVFETMGGALN